jgi:hypothetical protein
VSKTIPTPDARSRGRDHISLLVPYRPKAPCGLEGDIATARRRTNLNEDIFSNSYTQLQGLKAEINAHPEPEAVVEYIKPCIKALDDLSGPFQPDVVWYVPKDWPVDWDDTGEYSSHCDYPGPRGSGFVRGDVGYGPQNPPVNNDGRPSSTTFTACRCICLPCRLFSLLRDPSIQILSQITRT